MQPKKILMILPLIGSLIIVVFFLFPAQKQLKPANFKETVLSSQAVNSSSLDEPKIKSKSSSSSSSKQNLIMEKNNNFFLSKINNFRKSKGLSAVRSDSNSCDFAEIRVKEVIKNFNHEGFYKRVNDNNLPYPSYKEVTENLAQTEDYTKVIDLWINSPAHSENMQKDTPFVCVANSGNYYVYEGWKP